MTEEERVRRTSGIAQMDGLFSAHTLRRRRLSLHRARLWLLFVNTADAVKRLADILVSGVLLIILAPLMLALHLRNRSKGGTLLASPRLGQWGTIFRRYSFSSGPFAGLPALLNVWRGDMSLIGPRAVPPGEAGSSERLAWRRFDVRPGLLCLWWIRVRANIAYGNEPLADAEYVETRSLAGDLGIGLRALPAFLYGREGSEAPSHVNLIGIPINNLTMEEAVDSIIGRCACTVPSQVCFVNADCANVAWTDKEYAQILSSCGLVLADGIGIKLAGKLLNRNIRQNVNGTDMFPELCRALAKEGLGIYLLGGVPGVAGAVADWMKLRFPSLLIRGTQHGYFTPSEMPEVLEQIRHSGADVLLVAFGVPKQERWIHDHLAETGVKVNIGVGGLFDFYSGRMRRAPVWVREIGMEWLYRLCQEPRRMWRRYLIGNVVFLARVLRGRSRQAVSL